MKTSKQLKEQLAQIRKDAAESVCEFLGDRDSIKTDVDIDDSLYARRLYRKDGKVFIEVYEPEPYENYPGADEYGMVTLHIWIERLSTFQLILFLEGLESA